MQFKMSAHRSLDCLANRAGEFDGRCGDQQTVVLTLYINYSLQRIVFDHPPALCMNDFTQTGFDRTGWPHFEGHRPCGLMFAASPTGRAENRAKWFARITG